MEWFRHTFNNADDVCMARGRRSFSIL